MPPPSSISSAGEAHTAATRMTDSHLVRRKVDHRRVRDDDVGSVEEDEGPHEGLGLGLARVLHRGHDGVVGDGARVGQIDLAVGSELQRVDGAVAPTPGVDALAGRAAQPEQAMLLRGLHRSVGRIGNRVPVGDGGQVVHAGHRFVGRAGVLSFGLGCFARNETDDVVDPAQAGAPPAGRHPGALGQCLGRAGIDGVEQRGGGSVQPDQGEGEGVVEGVLLGGGGHPGPRRDGAGRTDLDEVVRQLGTGGGVPLHRRDEDRVTVANAEDTPLGQGGHECADHRARGTACRGR